MLDHMRAGDVLTHCFTPYDNCVVGADGKPRPEVLEAMARGVLLDVGHGSGSFSFPAAEAWFRAGQPVPIIGTDLHRRSVLGPAFDLQTVMTKMLAAGSSDEDVLRSVTVRPAAVMQEVSRFSVWAPADVVTLDLVSHPSKVWDSRGAERVAPLHLRCGLTVLRGDVAFVDGGVRVLGI